VRAVPASRAGLASAVNNTSRQAAGAMGIAICGAIVGAPAAAGFISGLHLAALVAAGLFLAAALVTLGLVPRAAADSRHRTSESSVT
jgi:DHA2 family methylenomycin A resistance protein-like MFS transporter